MQVEIFSFMAAAVGGREVTWRGTVFFDQIGCNESSSEQEILNGLWRFFNRVDGEDAEILDKIGYELPSLSVGDFITWDGNTYRVAGRGFDKITGNIGAVMDAFYTDKADLNPEQR